MVKTFFFSPVSGTNIRAGYACTGNALIGLVGIRGKTCFSGQLHLENCHQNKFYRECQPIQWERYPCMRSQRWYLCLTQGKKLIFTTVEIDFYHRGNWFLPPWKLIITTGEIDFYHHRKENVWFQLTSFYSFYFLHTETSSVIIAYRVQVPNSNEC